MPLRNLLLQHLIDQFMLLDYRQALEPGRLDLDCIHGATAAADVLDLGIGSACHSYSILCLHVRAAVTSDAGFFGLPLSFCPAESDLGATQQLHRTLW